MADEIEFGTGGWRAIIADTFTRLNVERVAQALADRIHDENQEHRPVVIGYDQRFLSPEFAWWAAEVLAGNDIVVRIIDRPAPTPDDHVDRSGPRLCLRYGGDRLPQPCHL